MTETPELDEFIRQIEALRTNKLLAPHIKRGQVHFRNLTLETVSVLLREETAYYFLTAAAGLNRTSLKKASEDEAAGIVQKPMRRAYAVKSRLPIQQSFDDIASSALALRRGDLQRRTRGQVEALFRERLKAEQIPILMSPPHRLVPGILISRRKPDGVYPDPSSGAAPLLYLEIKNVRRVSDDIQKRLYEVAEAAVEMKLLYGDLKLEGRAVSSTTAAMHNLAEIRSEIRARIRNSRPTVVVLLLCSRTEAERYRDGAEAFVDRVFFQEEIEDCLEFLKEAVR